MESTWVCGFYITNTINHLHCIKKQIVQMDYYYLFCLILNELLYTIKDKFTIHLISIPYLLLMNSTHLHVNFYSNILIKLCHCPWFILSWLLMAILILSAFRKNDLVFPLSSLGNGKRIEHGWYINQKLLPFF